MQTAMLLTAVLALGARAGSNLTITPADDGTGWLWLSWIDDDDTGAVARYSGATPEHLRLFYCYPDGISSTLTRDGSGGLHLMVSMTETLVSLDPFGDMATEDAVFFNQIMPEYCGSGLLRRSVNPAEGLLGRFLVTYLSSQPEFFWFTREYTVSEDGGIAMGDSLMLYLYNLRSDEGFPRVEEPTQMTFPVTTALGNPVMGTRRYTPGGSFPPTPARWKISVQCHNRIASGVYLTEDEITSSTVDSGTPILMASGSSASDALFIWSDSAHTVHCSLHDCEYGITATAPFTGQGPPHLSASSMSANPADPGILLAWYDSGNIMGRHYHEGWNDYAHVLAEDIPFIEQGNLAVCSVEDGYWVAYRLVQQTFPILFFVSREDVTGITEHAVAVEQASISAHPNPFSETLSIAVTGIEGQFEASLYDYLGRLVRHSVSSGFVLWNTSGLPTGCYLVRVVTPAGVHNQKAVLISP